MVILSTFMFHIFLPGFAIVWLWKVSFRSKLQWLALAALTSGTIAAIFVIGSWGWYGIVTRYLMVVLFAGAALSSYRRVRPLPTFRPEGVVQVIVMATLALAGVAVWGIALLGTSGYAAPDGVVDLTFPIRGGHYVVGHGGGNPLINYHNVHPSQMYALDIGAMNSATTRAVGLYPKKLEAYAIYGDTLVSPCNGVVAAVRDTLPDNVPPQRDSQNVAGNFLAFECVIENGATAPDTIVVYFAHLQPGTATVTSGARVAAGQPVGVVGNSGNTTEPHLHVHAERGRYTGKFSGQPGTPVTFDGRWLVRNSVVW